MGSNGVIVEGFGRNSGDDDCMLNCLPEMKNVCFEHFKPFQDKMSLVLQHSRSHFSALAGRESFAGFLNVPLISDVLVKTIEVMFDAPKPCVVQPQNDEASANISWLDVVKERNYQAEYKGNGIYHFHMQDSGVIVHLSAFQHNMILSGLPRKLVQPWSYEKDVQTELNTLALAAEMTTLLNELASEGRLKPCLYPVQSLTSPCSHQSQQHCAWRDSKKRPNSPSQSAVKPKIGGFALSP